MINVKNVKTVSEASVDLIGKYGYFGDSIKELEVRDSLDDGFNLRDVDFIGGQFIADRINSGFSLFVLADDCE